MLLVVPSRRLVPIKTRVFVITATLSKMRLGNKVFIMEVVERTKHCFLGKRGTELITMASTLVGTWCKDSYEWDLMTKALEIVS